MDTTTQTAGPIESTGIRVRSKVQEVVAPRVEPHLKVAQDKYLQLKQEYPTAATTLETAERRISQFGESVAKGYNGIVKAGDGAISENLTAPYEKVKSVVVEESEKEEFKNAKAAGRAFFTSLTTLLFTCSMRLVDFTDEQVKSRLPEATDEMVQVDQPEEPSLFKRVLGVSARVANSAYSFFLKKSTLRGHEVDFRSPKTASEYLTPAFNMVKVFGLGLTRYACELSENYRWAGAETVHIVARFTLEQTDFSPKRGSESASSEVSSAAAPVVTPAAAPIVAESQVEEEAEKDK
uniref:Uncharacterized protein n=1 Tax=Rhodosorus marinus TaxID=101924 RepID=A0A7S0BV44_9RHOD|mmetsp:Transcript_934/g.1460  ORF Transcript_934/g.1460 Transcript_934/m.1460 type:complete len:294 (+) Transcript_934:108-989(+)